MEIERQALLSENKKEKALKETEKKLNQLKEKNDELSAKWSAERITFEQFHNLRKRVEGLKKEAEMAEREANLEKVAKIIYGELPQAEKEYKNFEKKFIDKKKVKGTKFDDGFIKEAVDEEDIAAVVSRWTGIPVSKMLESETGKLLKIEENLSERVIGQEEAIKTIANALRRARAGLAPEDRPLGSFMFLGPTGVGKTELVRALAEFMFNDEKALIRVDMSEYMERHSVSRLIGSPPGYVGHEEGGQLTETVRHRPYSLILFDEIEKAHPEVFNILLQVLDNGRLTDGKGKVVNFKNTIIVLTSNVGSEYFQEISRLGFEVGSEKEKQEIKVDDFKNRIKEALKETFRPEFLNRLDEIVIFNSLGKEEIGKIVDLQLEIIMEKLVKKGIKATIDNSLKKHIIDTGYEPEYGARPIKRMIQKLILDELANRIISGELKNAKKIKIGFKESHITISA